MFFCLEITIQPPWIVRFLLFYSPAYSTPFAVPGIWFSYFSSKGRISDNILRHSSIHFCETFLFFFSVFRCLNQSFDREKYLQYRKQLWPYLCASLIAEKSYYFFLCFWNLFYPLNFYYKLCFTRLLWQF